MIQLYRLALRDVARNRRRSFFSALALGMGVALLLLGSAVINGELRGSLDASIRLQSGHLQVRARNYSENKTSLKYEDLVADPQTVAAKIAALPQVELATPRLFASGIASSSDKSVGVRMFGIDPASPANAPYLASMVSGQFVKADDLQGIVIGETLAKKLALQTGSSVNLLVNTANGTVDEQPFIVRGIFNTHTPAFDQNTIFIPLAKAQSITQTENHASTIFVLLKNQDDTDAVASALQSSQYNVVTYKQMNELLAQMDQLVGGLMVVIYLIVLGITAAVVVNALLMSVFERTREIGILSAIGMKSTRIMAMFFAESSLLAVGGIIIGLILGSLAVAYFAKVGFQIGNVGLTNLMLGDRIYAYPDVNNAIILCMVAFIVTLLAALYPARLAANMEPVEALRGGKQA